MAHTQHVNHNLDLYVGDKLRHIRKANHWTLENLAEKTGLSPQQIHKYETAANKLSISFLYEIARIFEVPVSYFYEGYNSGCYEQHRTGFNLLLIEDNIKDEILIREAITDFPTKINIYSIREGDKASDFLRSLNQTTCLECVKPDLILLELKMSRANGIETLKTIKRDRQLHSTPVVLLTDSTNINDMESSYNCNASGLIVKAQTAGKLKEQMHNMLAYWTEVVSLPKKFASHH